jgi:hypothetical protein
MGNVDDKKFALAVSTMQALESLYVDAPSQRGSIEKRVAELMKGMTDEQLTAVTEYQRELVQQAEKRLRDVEEQLREAESELNRRKKG